MREDAGNLRVGVAVTGLADVAVPFCWLNVLE